MVRLKRLIQSDASQLAQLLNNKKIWDNLRDFVPYPYGVSDAQSFINMTTMENPPQTFGIHVDDFLCGVIGLVVQSDVYRLSAEIGYWIGEEYWGKGIATDAVTLMTSYGFKELGLERIHTGVFDYNIASMKVLENNGFKKEGVFKNAIIKNGKICDEHRFALLNKTH